MTDERIKQAIQWLQDLAIVPALAKEQIRNKPRCHECGDVDLDLNLCAGCGKMFCDDCIDWCFEPHDEACGDWFCRGFQE